MLLGRVVCAAATALLAVGALACGGGESSTLPTIVELPVTGIALEAGEELNGLCYSMTIGNDDPIFVDSVDFHTGPGWHHSNWFFSTEEYFEGPDGAWPCDERQFSEVAATLAGGVLFAQSTQATDEVQTLPAGVAIAIPPRARVIGNIHLINAQPDATVAEGMLKIHRVERETVTTRVSAMLMTFYPLRIPALRRSEFRTSCDLSTAMGAPPAFNFYWLLPHYHGLGERMKLDAMGGALEGTTIFETQADVGDPGGKMLDPRFGMTGADGLEFGCRYNNTTDHEVGWGIHAENEMCMMLGFTDSPKHIIAGVLWNETANELGVSDEGVVGFDGPCTVALLPNDALYF